MQKRSLFYGGILRPLGGQGAQLTIGECKNALFRIEICPPCCFANGGTIGFKCSSAEQVQAFHDAAIAHGGRSIEEPPGLRQGSLGPLYLAYVRDPDGNKLCALYRVPQAS